MKTFEEIGDAMMACIGSDEELAKMAEKTKRGFIMTMYKRALAASVKRKKSTGNPALDEIMVVLETSEANTRRFYFSAKHHGQSLTKYTDEAHRRFQKYAVVTRDVFAMLHVVALDADGNISGHKVCGIIQVTREKVTAGTVKQELKKAFGFLAPTIVVEPVRDDDHWVAKFAKLKDDQTNVAASRAKLASLGFADWVEEGVMPVIPPVAMEA